MITGLLGTFALVAAFVCAALAYRAFRQHRNAPGAFAIRTPNAIDEALFVRIGGIDQWIQIRGEDRANPIILVLHGGMAMSYMAFTRLFQPWERYFTVVQWDRRGVGKTFGRNRRGGHGEMSLERVVLDGIELSELLRKRLQKETNPARPFHGINCRRHHGQAATRLISRLCGHRASRHHGTQRSYVVPNDAGQVTRGGR